MVTTLDDVKRTAIAMKLADMKAMQNLLISNDQQIISACTDADMRKRMQDILEDDQKNLAFWILSSSSMELRPSPIPILNK